MLLFFQLSEDYGGVNDRLSLMGLQDTSRLSLRRLSTLPQLHDMGVRGENSEGALLALHRLGELSVDRIDAPFCVVTPSIFRFDVLRRRVGSSLANNGEYCKLCPLHEESYIEGKGPSAEMLLTEDSGLCQPKIPWDSQNASVITIPGVGDDILAARELLGESFQQCIMNIKTFIASISLYQGPSAEVICSN